MKLHVEERIAGYIETVHSRVSDVVRNLADSSEIHECVRGSGRGLCYTRNSRFGRKHVNLGPGDYLVSEDDIVVSTVLGSCISACLYSDTSPCFGMNHFLLPESCRNDACEDDIMRTSSAFYGINAMELVINAMLHAGVKKHQLRAKVFGGGNVLKLASPRRTVGEQNVEFVLRFLEIERIPVTACSVGGDCARKIIYVQHSRDVLLQRLGHSADSVIATEEEKLYHRGIRKPEVSFFG